MKIKIRENNINNYNDYKHIEKELIQINKNLDLFNKLITDKKINYNDYINIINKLYNIQLNDNDLIRISSLVLGEPSKVTILKSNMIYDAISQININNYFEYIEKQQKLYLKVAYTDNKIINFKHTYTPSEILKLIKNKKIVLLEFVLEEDNDLDFYEEYEFNGLCPIKSTTLDNYYIINNPNKNYLFYTN